MPRFLVLLFALLALAVGACPYFLVTHKRAAGPKLHPLLAPTGVTRRRSSQQSCPELPKLRSLGGVVLHSLN